MKNNRVFWEALLQVLTRVRLFFSILYERALPLKYANLPMDLADASLIILAEHLGHGRLRRSAGFQRLSLEKHPALSKSAALT
jgi:uncharacterized membrane protein